MVHSYEYIQFLNEKVLTYLPLDKIIVGDKVNFRCPICGDSHKSLTKKRGFYYLKNASFYCFNCGTSLPGIKFLQMLSGSDYDEIKREYIKIFLKANLNNDLSSFFSRPDSEPDIFSLKRVINPEWKKPLTQAATEYLEGRRVLSAPFLREPLYSCFGKNKQEYIMIPWVVNGVDAYYQLNDFQKHGPLKYVFPKNKHKLVYGLDNVDMNWNRIIVFEGVYDSLFVKNAVAVGTKSITDYQMKLIRERYPNHQICVSFDNDQPGMQSMAKLIESGANLRFFKWFGPETTAKDVNERVLEIGDVNMFSNPVELEKMIFTPLQLKMWMIRSGNWIVNKKKAAAAVNRRKTFSYDQRGR